MGKKKGRNKPRKGPRKSRKPSKRAPEKAKESLKVAPKPEEQKGSAILNRRRFLILAAISGAAYLGLSGDENTDEGSETGHEAIEREFNRVRINLSTDASVKGVVSTEHQQQGQRMIDEVLRPKFGNKLHIFGNDVIPLIEGLENNETFQGVSRECRKTLPGLSKTMGINDLRTVINSRICGISHQPYFLDQDKTDDGRNFVSFVPIKRPIKCHLEIPHLGIKTDFWKTQPKQDVSYSSSLGEAIAPLNLYIIFPERVKADQALPQFLTELHALSPSAKPPEAPSDADSERQILIHEGIHIRLQEKGWLDSNNDTLFEQRHFRVGKYRLSYLHSPTLLQINEAIAISLSNANESMADTAIIESTVGNLTTTRKAYELYRVFFWQLVHQKGWRETPEAPPGSDRIVKELAQLYEKYGTAAFREIHAGIAQAIWPALPQDKSLELPKLQPSSTAK